MTACGRDNNDILQRKRHLRRKQRLRRKQHLLKRQHLQKKRQHLRRQQLQRKRQLLRRQLLQRMLVLKRQPLRNSILANLKKRLFNHSLFFLCLFLRGIVAGRIYFFLNMAFRQAGNNKLIKRLAAQPLVCRCFIIFAVVSANNVGIQF